MTVITISREFGAGGSSVARLVADALGADLVDRELVSEVARRLEYPESTVESVDERPPSFADRLLLTLRYLAPAEGLAMAPDQSGGSLEPRIQIVSLTQELIREVARHGNAVIVGRGAAFVLRDHPNAFHVFLRAAEDVRVETVRERLLLSEHAARQRLHRTDAERATYLRRLYHADWQDSAHYDLVIDTGRLGIPRAAELIVETVAKRWGTRPRSLQVVPPVPNRSAPR